MSGTNYSKFDRALNHPDNVWLFDSPSLISSGQIYKYLNKQ